MRFSLFWIGLSLFGYAHASAQEPLQLVQQVRDKLAKVKNYRAAAVMSTDIPFLKIPSSNVTVFFKDPDKFRIQQQSGISITPKGGMDVNFSTLFAIRHFTALDAGTVVLNDKKLRAIKMLPMDESSPVVISTLYIDPQSLLIHRAVTTSKDNGTFEIEMQYGRYAAWGLPDKVAFLFNIREYKLPKGIAFDYETNASKVKQPEKGNEKGSVSLSYTSYIINKGVPDSVFSK